MKINFTEEEYKLLLDLIYMADWILHAHSDAEERLDTKEYSDFQQIILSYAKDTKFKDLVEYDAESNKYYATILFEESAVTEHIEEFEDNSFWEELTHRLAKRDAISELKNDLDDLLNETYLEAISEAEEKWNAEFESYGLDRIIINKIQTDSIH